MAVSQYTMIYLGTLADMDPNETNRTPENYATVLGGKTFGSTDSPLFASSTRVSLNDVNDNDLIGFNHDNNSTDRISYQIDNTVHTAALDTGLRVRASVTQRIEGGGTRTIVTELRLFQDTLGRVFIAPP